MFRIAVWTFGIEVFRSFSPRVDEGERRRKRDRGGKRGERERGRNRCGIPVGIRKRFVFVLNLMYHGLVNNMSFKSVFEHTLLWLPVRRGLKMKRLEKMPEFLEFPRHRLK